MIYVGSDHAGYELKCAVCEYLKENDLEYEDEGTYSLDSVDYPLIAKKVCEKIKEGDRGILICGTGIGMSIASNRFKHIRAGLCYDAMSAKLTRNHNNANVLVLRGRNQIASDSLEIVKTFLTESFEGGRHQRRVDELREL